MSQMRLERNGAGPERFCGRIAIGFQAGHAARDVRKMRRTRPLWNELTPRKVLTSPIKKAAQRPPVVLFPVMSVVVVMMTMPMAMVPHQNDS
jgi:hypothetical protein